MSGEKMESYMTQQNGGDKNATNQFWSNQNDISKNSLERIMETNENLNEIETTETKKSTKESAKYDVNEMSFMAGGVKRIYTFDHDAITPLHGSIKKLILMGARNVVIDSVASMTLTKGFTYKQRLQKMSETMSELNNGKITERIARENYVKLSTLADITDINAIRAFVKSGIPLNAVQKAILEKTLDDTMMEDAENNQ